MRDPKAREATLVTCRGAALEEGRAKDVNTSPRAHFPPSLLRALIVLATSCGTVRIQLGKFFT